MHCWHTRASVWIATSFRLRPRAGHHRPLRHTQARESELIATHTQDLATGVGVGVCMYLCVCVCVLVRVCVCVCVCMFFSSHTAVTSVSRHVPHITRA